MENISFKLIIQYLKNNSVELKTSLDENIFFGKISSLNESNCIA